MENLRRQIEELIKTKNSESKSYFTWLKFIISLNVTLLGILIALRDSSNQTKIQHIVYAITIVLMLFSIIFGSLLVFIEVKLLRLEIIQREEWLIKYYNGTQSQIEIETIDFPWYFHLLKIITIACFYLSITSLVTYSLISEFQNYK
jgi:hypothetical protein